MNRKSIYIFIALSLFLLGFILWTVIMGPGYNNSGEASSDSDTSLPAGIKEGKQLSKKYCSTCHTYPEPGLLDKETWVSQTLPNMAPRLGIYSHDGNAYPTENTPNLPASVYPDTQLVSHEQWQKILDYYQHEAPDTLVAPERKDIAINRLFFEAHTPDFRAESPPMVTAIRMDPINKLIYLGNASDNRFYIFNRNLDFESRFSLTSPISDIRLLNDITEPGRRDLLTTYIGDLNPSDALKGFIQPVWYNPQTGNGGAGSVIIDSLARPVETTITDLNEDGVNDLLVNQFGHRTGSLFWLEGTGGRAYANKKNTLINTPGCIESHITDFTGNGHPDVVTLCTQLDQAIYLFENTGKGQFKQQKLLQFDIAAGSSSFKLHDFNNDGKLDILYTSGDNADYSIIYKPYHGIYIYLNQGNNRFTERWFYPINGAYDAVARDFDGDGDSDLATIAFFADYDNNPREGFVFFRNEGDFSFSPSHHPAASGGRWIAMDVNDWTGNGLDDIVLANFSLGPTRVTSLIQKKFTEGPHFILLENKTNKATQ